MPTPRISPRWVFERSNSLASESMIMIRMMNAKEVAVRAMKQAQKSLL